MRRPITSESGGSSFISKESFGNLAKLAPTLVEFLADEKWEDDGSPRRTGTLMLLVEDGMLKAWLHDRESCTSCWISGSTLETLWKASEKALTEGRGWRPDKDAGRRK